MHAQVNGSGAGTGKFTAWEGGHREASFAYWPRGVKNPGRVSDTTLHVVDILPTLAALAGVPLPSDRQYDGADFSDILTSGGDAPLSPPRDTLFHQTGSEFVAARRGRFKAFFKTAAAGGCDQSVPVPRDQVHDPPLLFDLEADPAESTPVVNASLAAEFTAALAQKLGDINSTYRTRSNYSGGGDDWWACCNAANAACQCSL
jgi:arylsulfatase A-like enzyme